MCSSQPKLLDIWRLVVVTVVSLVALLACLLPASAAGAVEGPWVWPLDPVPTVVRGFEAPADPYGPGHRGVDLAGIVGQQVHAIGAGTVSFSGVVAGRGVVVVRHGRVSSTYEPVTSTVHRGQAVDVGQTIGLLQSVHSHCSPATCLHLGLKRGTIYLDPLSLFGALPVHLKSLDGDTSSASAPIAASDTPVGSRADGHSDTSDRRESGMPVVGALGATALLMGAGLVTLIGAGRRQARG